MEIESAINIINERAKVNIAEGDYIGEDGLLYCSKCNTPKQSRIQFFFGERIVYHMCQCEQEKREAEENERKKKAFAEMVKDNRIRCFEDSDMSVWTFENADNDEEKAITAARNYVSNFSKLYADGKGLLLYGSVGSGKTFAAACIANALLDKGFKVRMTNFATIRNTVAGMWEGRQEYYEELNACALLIIDDLSIEAKSEYMQEIIYNVIDNRYRSGRPMIITTNLTGEELKHPAEISYQRIFSRLFEMCFPLEVAGTDRRKAKLKEEFADMKNLLGI